VVLTIPMQNRGTTEEKRLGFHKNNNSIALQKVIREYIIKPNGL